MGSLSSSSIDTGQTINPVDINNLYNIFTGTKNYDNIGLAEFTYLNAGGVFGSGGYGFRDNGGTIEFRNNLGTWAVLGSGAGEANEDSFKTIAIAGQTDVVADNTTDTLTFVEGTGMTLTTSGDTITFASSGGGGGTFAGSILQIKLHMVQLLIPLGEIMISHIRQDLLEL